MTRTRMFHATLAVVAIVTGSAAAQGTGGKEQPLAAFLQQRVAEELATDGTLLSRLGVTLEIEIVGDAVLVSLVDSTTHRVVASTKVDRISGDREAIVAQVTHVAGALTEQIAHAVPRAAASPDDPDPAEQKRLAAGEARYRESALSFSAGSWSGDGPVPVRGPMRRPLGETEFFEVVGRPDLADEYRAHRRHAVIGLAASGASVVTGVSLAYFLSQRETYLDDDEFYLGATAVGLVVGGTLGALVSTYLLTHAFPIEQRDVRELANAYNRRLRAEYSLPLVVTPYVAADGAAGVSVRGGF